MATLVLTAVGTAVGGPLGGAIGALVGNKLDRSLFGPGGREGPRLQELKVTSSSYGTPIARHYGRVRSAGSIIWSTDLIESSSKSGGKGKPSVTSFSYAISFAVALSSRPIIDVGRIWADGNLLRGAAGDLKVGGELRIYRGHGDQAVDPLLASDCGPGCPAFRGTAYCVFEGLQLAEYGNRIPTLTFEIVADNGDVTFGGMIPDLETAIVIDRPLDALAGFSEEGGSLISTLETIDQLYPFACDASGDALAFRSVEHQPGEARTLETPAVDPSGDSFGTTGGQSRRRQADLRELPEGLRYYDLDRDFQPGLQRADGRARPGRSRIIEFPGALLADDARSLATKAAERASREHERLSWRMAELDPTLSPGQVVRIPGRKGLWRIDNWEWRETGVELELLRLPHGPARAQAGDAGAMLPQSDLVASPTMLRAFELPWDGDGTGAQRAVHAAVSSENAGWTGAALFIDQGGILQPAGGSGRRRSVLGQLEADLPAGMATLIDRNASLLVDLASADFVLSPATVAGLANGANRALVGDEIVQFAGATRIEGSIWRLSTLLRGRAGTEAWASQPHPAGRAFVLLDDKPLLLDAAAVGQATVIAATGLADSEPVLATITMAGATLRPLVPVHPRVSLQPDGALHLSWTRRARGAWNWRDLVDAPLNEEAELYRIGVGNPASPPLQWEVAVPWLVLPAAMAANLLSNHSGEPIWVRQVGSHAASAPLLLHTIP
jgi:hypothetical protein